MERKELRQPGLIIEQTAQRQKEKIERTKLFADFPAKNIRLTIFEWAGLFNIATNYRAMDSLIRNVLFIRQLTDK